MIQERPFVPIEQLVDPDRLQKADDFDLNEFVYRTKIRGKELDWLCLSRRLLWMASGHEYIEPELLDWIDAIPGEAILYDVGASNGLFALYAAARGLRVFAFEPDPLNYFLLAYNCYLNSKSSGTSLAGCFNLAISNSSAVGRIQIKKMELGGHEKILDKKEDVFGNQFEPEFSLPVLKCSLDHLIGEMRLPQPGFVKIDVDGSESAVLDGFSRGITRVQSIFIELTEESIATFANSFLESQGFALHKKFQVQNYAGLFNCIFRRQGK